MMSSDSSQTDLIDLSTVPSIHLQPEKPSYRTLVVILILFVICIGSLASSYIFFTSIPFRFEFGALHFNAGTQKLPAFLTQFNFLQGAIIELLRALLILGIAYYYFGSRFRTEFKVLFCLSSGTHPAEHHRRHYRILAAVAMLFASFFVIKHHLYGGPNALEARFMEHVAQGIVDPHSVMANRHAAFVQPYLWFLPYSFILYVVLAVPFFATGAFGLEADWKHLRTLRSHIDDEIKNRIDPVNFKVVYEGFFEDCVRFCGRYGAFIFLLSLAVSFESYIARYTLTQVGARWVVFGYALAGIIALSVVVAVVTYSATFQRAHNYVGGHHGDIRSFTDEFGPMTLMKHILKTYALMFWGVFLLGGVFPFIRVFISVLQ